MRIRVSPLLAALVVISPRLHAQAPFEGIITFAATPGGNPVHRVFVKGARARFERGVPGGAMIMDESKRLIRLVDARHLYVIVPQPPQTPAAPKFEALGKRDTIAGYSCDYYRMTSTSPNGTEVCVTTALGFVGVTPGGGALDARLVQAQFPMGFFILKSISNKQVLSEVSTVERMALSDTLFAPPASYRQLRLPGAP